MEVWDATTPDKKSPLPEAFSFSKGNLSLLEISDSLENPVKNTLYNGWENSPILTISKDEAPETTDYFFSLPSTSYIYKSQGLVAAFTKEKVKTTFKRPSISTQQ